MRAASGRPGSPTHLGCDDQTVLDALHAFNAARAGRRCARGSSRPTRTRPAAFGPEQAERLRALLHHSPRGFGKPTSLWTLELAAEVSFAEGIEPTRVTGETIRADAAAAGHWLEAGQALDHQPRPGVCPKKGRRDRLIAVAEQHPDWALGFADETWWSRLAQPHLHTWADADEGPLRLVEQTVAQERSRPQGAGLLRRAAAPARAAERVWLRFVDGRPVSAITEQFLDWCCDQLQETGVRVWLLIWDNASWHVSKRVRAWIRAHNRAGQAAGARACASCRAFCPSRVPWLNPIEPKWVHGKRAIVEPARLLSAQEVADRVCAHFGCSHESHLTIPDKAA